MLACWCTSRARSLAATKPRPGGVIRPFCEPDIATSTPQPSISNGMQPSEATVSTMYSAGWPVARPALDAVGFVLAQPRLDFGRADGAAKVALQHLDFGAHRGGGGAPVDRET